MSFGSELSNVSCPKCKHPQLEFVDKPCSSTKHFCKNKNCRFVFSLEKSVVCNPIADYVTVIEIVTAKQFCKSVKKKQFEDIFSVVIEDK